MAKILVVEDDCSMRELLHAKLSARYEVATAANGRDGLKLAERTIFDVIIADIMMPQLNGYELVRELRQQGITVPIILATAKQDFEDKREGFTVGADDYMVKPINFEELIWRINALLRRAKIAEDKEIVIGKFTLSATTYQASYEGNVIELTRKEFDLTYKLLSYPNKLFSHTKLLDEIWGLDCPSGETTIRSHINRLRNKFEHIPEFEIITVRGIGYKAVIK